MQRFQILSLDGGGIRGAFSVALLAKFEEKLGRSITESFDLIAGTSTGAIIAAGLAAGRTAAEVYRFYQDYGHEIFFPNTPYRGRGWTRGPYPLLRRIFGVRTGLNIDHFFQPRYCRHRLEHALREGFGDTRLGDLRHARFLTPAVNLSEGRTCVFRTPHLPNPGPHVDYPILELLQAATAAPTYFPHKELADGKAYCDGGLWAANPSVLGFAEAMKIQQLCDRPDCDPDYDTSAMRILSIGTGRSSYSLSPLADAGILYWSKHVANVMTISQVQGVQTPLEYLLDSRYHHINFALPDETWALDNVEHLDDLFSLGRIRGEEEFENVAARFFDVTTQPYVPFVRGVGTRIHASDRRLEVT